MPLIVRTLPVKKSADDNRAPILLTAMTVSVVPPTKAVVFPANPDNPKARAPAPSKNRFDEPVRRKLRAAIYVTTIDIPNLKTRLISKLTLGSLKTTGALNAQVAYKATMRNHNRRTKNPPSRL